MKYVIRPLFETYQKELVAFANTSYGKDFVSQFGGKELKENYPIIKVTPDGVYQDLGGGTHRAVFHPGSPYVGLFANILTTLDIAFENNKRIQNPKLQSLVIPHFMGETRLMQGKLPQIYLTEVSFNPDADTESTSVDGEVRYVAASTWDEARDAGTGTSASDDSTENWGWFARKDSDPTDYNICRSFFLFDTSGIPSEAVISSAVLYFTVTDHPSQYDDDSGSVHVIETAPASNTALTTADFDAVTFSGFGSRAVSTMSSDDTEYDITLTDTSKVIKEGITKLGLMHSLDLSDTEPTGQNLGGIYYADNGSNKPKLTVTYTATIPRHGFTNHQNPGIV